MTAASDLIKDGRAYAANQLSDADAALSDAIGAIQQIGYTNISYSALPMPAPPSNSLGLTAPVLADITLELPAAPANTLVFQDIPAIDAGTAPTFTATAPVFSLPMPIC